jgi:hypothetical protein
MLQRSVVGSTTVWCHPAYRVAAVLDVVAQHCAALSTGDKRVLKTTRHRSMSLVCLDNGHGLDSGQVEDGQQGEEVFIKHYHPSSTKKRLSQRWRRICNARLVYGTSQEFASRGMRIPMVIAVVEGGGKNQGESFLLTSSVSHLPNVARQSIEITHKKYRLTTHHPRVQQAGTYGRGAAYLLI